MTVALRKSGLYTRGSATAFVLCAEELRQYKYGSETEGGVVGAGSWVTTGESALDERGC